MEKLTPLYGQVGLYIMIMIINNIWYSFRTDRTGFPPIITIVNVVKMPVYAYVVVLVTIGVILCLICLVFNIIFRKRK